MDKVQAVVESWAESDEVGKSINIKLFYTEGDTRNLCCFSPPMICSHSHQSEAEEKI